MGNSMKKFKKLAVLAITIPTLLSSTNISFAMESPKQCESTKKQNKKLKQYQIMFQKKINRNGPGGFYKNTEFMQPKMNNLSRFANSPSTEIFEELEKSYGHANACVVTCSNYIRSCISTLKLNKDGGATIKDCNKKEHIFENTEQIVDRILKTLTTTLRSIKDTKEKTNAWASIKYVICQLHEGVQSEYITSEKVFKTDIHLYKFICRGTRHCRSKRKFNIDLIKTLFNKLYSDDDYKDKGVNGDSSFGEFAFENAIKVCTINSSLPDSTTYSPANVYAPITSQEQYKFDTVDNSPIEQENMETQNTLNPQEQSIYLIPLKQLYLDGQGNVLFNQNVQYNDKCGFIAVQNDFTTTNIQDTYIVNSIFHDENGYIYNENGDFIYNNGQPVQLPFHISLNQLSLGGQGSVLYNPTVPCDDTSGFIIIQTALTTTNIPNIYIVNSLFHNENDCLFNRNGYFTYNNGQPVQLSLQQQSETITQGQYYYDTVDNSPFDQEEIQKQNKQVEDSKSPRQPESTKTGRKRTREYIDCQNQKCREKKSAQLNKTNNLKNGTKHKTYYCTKCEEYFTLDEKGNVVTRKTLESIDCQKCGVEKCAKPFGQSYTREKDGATCQQYHCTECRKYFTLDENYKVVKKVDRKNEYVECKRQKCKKYEKCAMPNGVPYTRIKDGKQIQRYFCTKCKTYFTQPINKNAEE